MISAIGLLLFWGGALALVYHHIGYPLALAALGALGVGTRPDRLDRATNTNSGADSEASLPSLTLIISAYNEEEVIERKIRNALELDYPADRLEILVASDGSTDRTNEIVSAIDDPRVTLAAFPQQRGKNLTLNDVMPRARGDIVVFTDANGMYRGDALHHLALPFLDPRVGSVCGELVYRNFNENPIAEGYNRYWELDQMQKRLEGELGCLLGANGSIFAVRKRLLRPVPNDVCNDMVQPIWVAAEGHLCVYEPRAQSLEAGSRNLDDELRRRSRIVGRGIRGIQAVWPDIQRTRSWLLGWELISRKGLRYLLPLWFAMTLVGSALAPGWFYRIALVLQIAAYLCIPLGFLLPPGPVKKLLSPAVYFGIGNLAAIQGWWKVLSGSELGRWQTADRPFEGSSAEAS